MASDTQPPAQPRAGHTPPRAGAGSRARALRLACLLAALALQLGHSLPRWDQPLVDGRLHSVWENARFLLAARHSNTPPAPDVRSAAPAWLRVFGTARYDYRPDGSPERLSFYSHHPLLVPALFRAWTAGFGYAPRAARSFALVFSLATTLLLWSYLGRALRGSSWAGALTLLYALLPLPWQYVDVWKYETPANLVLLAAVATLPGAAASAAARLAFLLSLAALGQADWNLYFALPVLLWPLWRRRAEPASRRLLRAAAGVALASLLLNAALLYALGFDLARIGEQGGYRIGGGLHGVSGLARWAGAQLVYLRTNLGWSGVALGGLGLVALLDPQLRRPNRLLHAALCFGLSGLLWISIFRNLSFIHHFVQWSFATGLVLLLAGLLRNAGERWPAPGARVRGALALLACALLALAALEAARLEARTRAAAFGTRGDIAALETLDCERLWIGSGGESGPPGWWESPVVRAAFDPIWRGRAGPVCAVRRIEFARELAAGDLVAVARADASAAALRALLRARFPELRLRERSRSPSFVFLGVASALGARQSSPPGHSGQSRATLPVKRGLRRSR